MPTLKVSLWTGRTREQKAAISKALTDAMVETAQVPAEAVTVIIEEWPQENWATGGKLHSELYPK
ncbi:MAG: 2-hydroxymuconate tautomerase family protein [Candidatus Latescibacterota bacterium]